MVRRGELRDGRGVTLVTEVVVGTKVYMAPEVVLGEVGPKADVFSLGVVLLELLTGLPPFLEGEGGAPGLTIISHVEDAMEEREEVEALVDGRFPLMEWRQVTSLLLLLLLLPLLLRQVFPRELYALAMAATEGRKRKRVDMETVVQRLAALFH